MLNAILRFCLMSQIWFSVPQAVFVSVLVYFYNPVSFHVALLGVGEELFMLLCVLDSLY